MAKLLCAVIFIGSILAQPTFAADLSTSDSAEKQDTAEIKHKKKKTKKHNRRRTASAQTRNKSMSKTRSEGRPKNIKYYVEDATNLSQPR